MTESLESEKTYHQLYYEKNKDKILEYYKEYGRSYYQNNKSKWKDYYQKNKDRILEYQSAYNSQNIWKIKEYQKKYWLGRKKYYKCQKKPKKEPAPKFEKRITIFYWD